MPIAMDQRSTWRHGPVIFQHAPFPPDAFNNIRQLPLQVPHPPRLIQLPAIMNRYAHVHLQFLPPAYTFPHHNRISDDSPPHARLPDSIAYSMRTDSCFSMAANRNSIYRRLSDDTNSVLLLGFIATPLLFSWDQVTDVSRILSCPWACKCLPARPSTLCPQDHEGGRQRSRRGWRCTRVSFSSRLHLPLKRRRTAYPEPAEGPPHSTPAARLISSSTPLLPS
jgi:hypothetical protein